MIILSVKNLVMAFGEDVLFKNVCFDVGESDKIGLIGANGTGKTTLFNLITGENGVTAENGETVKASGLKIGYMRQYIVDRSEASVYDEVMEVFSGLSALETELEEIHRKIDAGDTAPELLNLQMSLRERFEREGGLTYKSRVLSALQGLGFPAEGINKPVDVLSGGEKSKLSLAKLLLSESDLLLLDEPTNHLDINATAWLEKFLQDYRGAVITISHDRYFLDKITNRTFEIENNRLISYNGNYSEFVRKKEEAAVAARKKYELISAEIKRIEGIIEQQKRFNQAHNYVTIAHKQKSIDRLLSEIEEMGGKPKPPPRSLSFKFCTETGTGNDVLQVEKMSLSLGGKQLFKDVCMNIKKGERIFLIGANGSGKTSFLKVLTGEYTASGSFALGARVKLGYYDQAQKSISGHGSVFDRISDEFPTMTGSEIRTALGRFLFGGDSVFKKISALSGGEKARVALLLLMLGGSNFLLLDEPTNHLDINAREALECALSDYPGTLLIISHDRYLINKLADRIYELSGGEVTEYAGGYDYYLSQKEGCVEDHSSISEKTGVKAQITKTTNDYKQKKEQESEKRRTAGMLRRLETKIEELESRQTELNADLSSPDTSSDYEKVTKISAELSDIAEKLESLMEEWTELSFKFESI